MSRTTKNDHKKLKSLAILWLIALAPLMAMVPMLPKSAATEASGSTVVTVATDHTTSYLYYTGVSTQNFSPYTRGYPSEYTIIQDKNGRYWIFYPKNTTGYTQWVYTYSLDLTTWSAPTAIGACFEDSNLGICNGHTTQNANIPPFGAFNVDYDPAGSGKVYVTLLKGTRIAGTNYYNMLAREGTISGAAITWGTIQGTTNAVDPSDGYSGATWAGGTAKDPLSGNVTALVHNGQAAPQLYLQDSNNDWASLKSTVTFSSGAVSTSYGGASILALPNKQFIYVLQNTTTLQTRVSPSNYVNPATKWGSLQTLGYTDNLDHAFSVTGESHRNIVNMVYVNNSKIYFINGTVNLSGKTVSWDSPVLIESTINASTRPAIYYQNSTGNLHVFYSVNSVIYVKIFNAATGEWSNRYELEDAQTDYGGLTSDSAISTGKGIAGDNVTLLFRTKENGGATLRLIYYETLALPLTPSGTLALSGLNCGDVWVTPDKTYLTVTATIQAQTAIQNVSVRFNDSLHMIQADYDNTTARWNLSQGRDYVSLNPQATATSYYTAAAGLVSTDNYTLQVEFMFLANERILDKNDVDIQYKYALQNNTVSSWTSNATMSIYNKGGATEYVIQNNAGFLPGGDVYSVYAKNSSSIAVNQTWVRLQHLHANFAVRLVLNSTNSGEDNLWQDYAHKGANEYYTNSTDWTIYYKIWYYDEHNGAWVQGWILSFVKQQGDIGSADEWTEFNVTFYNGPNSEKTASQNMSAWVEREPEARVRLWIDLWFNKMNASSVHGARLNPMYFGIHYTGWALWGTGIAGQWEPMYKNESQAAAFDRLQDANGNENVTSPMLTCMKTEQILVMNDNTYALEGLSPLHYNYTIQIDNWDVLEPKLSPTRNMEGVNTPLIVEPLLPDKTASSFWAPIYAALASIGGWIFKAFSALAEIVWQAVRAQFPWFAEWVDNVNAALANGVEIANEMLSGIVEVLKMVGGQVWIFGFITDFIRETWEYIYPMLAPFTQNSTVWLTLLIIIFGILPIADNLSMGRWDLVRNDLEMIWGFMRTIIIGIYVIVTTLVGWIISALPL